MLDLRAFKGVYYDLDEIGLALDREDPGQEAIGRARKAVKRLHGFLLTVPHPTPGVFSDLEIIDRCLARQAKPKWLFGGQGLDRALGSARGVHRHLREYLEGLNLAWRVCALDSGLADQAAGLAGSC